MQVEIISDRQRIRATLNNISANPSILALAVCALACNSQNYRSRGENIEREFLGWGNWDVKIIRPWPADPISLFRVSGKDKLAPLIEGLEGPLTLELRPCVSPKIQKPQPQEITPAQQPEQQRSQPKEGTTMSQQVNASIPVQNVTFVFGHRIDHMGKTELFTAAQAVAAQIKGLEDSNKAVGSVAIDQEIKSLQSDLYSIRRLLDDKFSVAPALTGAAVTNEAAAVVATDAE